MHQARLQDFFHDSALSWFAGRPQAWKIEDFLTKWEGSCSGASASDPGKAAIALVLLQEIDTYRCDSTVALCCCQQQTAAACCKYTCIIHDV
jgi:hypothetical protein